MISHNGGIEGFNTALGYFPDDKLTVVVLANLNGSAPDELMPKLAAVAHGEPALLPSERKEITVSPKALSGYVGTYELAPRVNITMSLDGDRLMTQRSGQARVSCVRGIRK